SIVVEVPNREKDLELGRGCVAMSPLYRGLMADFLGWVIREGEGAVFGGRVEPWGGHGGGGVAGRAGAGGRRGAPRPGGAGVCERMAGYLEDVWPEAIEVAEEFAAVDVARMVTASVGSAEADQASTVFLEALRSLLDWAGCGWRGRAARTARGVAGRSSVASS